MRRILLGAGLALLSALLPEAWAGAWLAPKDGQQIWGGAAGERASVRTYETSGYVEAPIGDRYAVVTTSWIEQSVALEDGWRGEALAGVKRAVFREGPNIVAMQASALWRSDPPGNCGEGGAELRWLGGRGLGETAFANVELAGRLLDGGCNGARLDLTTGWRPAENWLAMGQLFIDAPDEGDESVKMQLSLTRFDRHERGIQLGVRMRLDGEDLEPALVLGIWSRVRD